MVPGPEQPPPNKGDQPRRHHTAAKFYLKRFAVGGYLELVRRDDPAKSFKRTIEQALTENHFYSIEVEDGERDAQAEKMLAIHVEDPAAQAFRRMFDDEACPLTARGRRAAISLFLAFQCVRGPSTRHMLVEHHRAVAAKVASMATPEMVLSGARARGEEMTEEEARDTAEFARSGKYTLEIERQANLHLGLTFPTVLEVVPFIYERTWRVLEFDEPCLLTSDEPVAYVQDPNFPGGPRGGLKTAPQIVFPIDPRRALVMIHPDFEAEDCRARGTPRQAEIINRHVAFNAHRFIVRTPGTNPLAGMTLSAKAPPVAVVGGIIGMTQNFSAEAYAEVVEGMRRYQRRRVG